MANSRELAEQAFSLLQDALKDSEARAAELDAELKKQRTPRNAVEEQAKVLEHRIETVEEECARWKRETAQLTEVLENERAKLRKVKKKLEIAESGPNSVDKKEVNFWRSRAEEFDKDTKEYKQRIAALRKELNARPEESDAIDPALLEQLETTRQEALELKTRIAELKVEVAAGDKTRAHAENLVRERDARLAEQVARIAALSAEAADLKGRLGSHDATLNEVETRLREREAESAQLKAAGAGVGRQIEELKAANDRLNSELADKHSEQNEQRHALETARRELAAREQTLVERDRRISELAEAARLAEEEKRSIRDQIAGLEDELKEEKECTVNLSQIANERREQITVLSEKLDEALERFEEAKWKLGRAGRFERIVSKRRTLIDSLLETIRAKQKSNTALKAGLDGLRKFKAKSEQQQQKMLVRIDELTAEIKAAHERQSGKDGGKDAGGKLRKAEENVQSLETRLEAQAKLIETLESDLRTVRASRQAAENQSREVTELKAAVEKKDATIDRLKADLDGLQMQLGKLRGSESETMRLKAVQEKDHSLIGDLEKEIKDLNDEVNRLRQSAEGGAQDATAQASGEIRRRDAQISDLKRTTKDQEKEIARLKEAVSGWQKKYEFLSAEPPSAYQTTPPADKQPEKQPARS